jgi:hypothetical protein
MPFIHATGDLYTQAMRSMHACIEACVRRIPLTQNDCTRLCSNYASSIADLSGVIYVIGVICGLKSKGNSAIIQTIGSGFSPALGLKNGQFDRKRKSE